jgi:hypothetical protein
MIVGRLTLLQGLLLNLDQEIERWDRSYLTREQALQMLRRVTGQDFGYNTHEWKEWLKANKSLVPGAEYEDFLK